MIRAACYQFPVTHAQPATNRYDVEQSIQSKKFDLLVLPELFTTGYLFENTTQLSNLAEEIPDGPTTEALITWARHHQAVIVASIAEKHLQQLYNTAIVVSPDGYLGKQRKIHLPRLEQGHFEAGNKLQVFDTAAGRLGVLSCFDAWFPETARILNQQGAQILCHPTNAGSATTIQIMQTRALENHLFSITTNRCGQESAMGIHASFYGHSTIYAPDGRVCFQAGCDEAFGSVTLDPEEASKKSNNFCNDFISEWSKYKIGLLSQ